MALTNPEQLVATTAVLAEVVGCSKTQISHLARKGVLSRVQRGVYDLSVAVPQYISYQTDQHKASEARRQIRERLFRERTRQLRLKNDATERELIRREEAADVMQGFAKHAARILRARFADEKLISGLVRTESVLFAHHRLGNWVQETLSDLSSFADEP